MKTLKILSFLLIGTIGVQTIFADDNMKFGIRAGLNLANIEYSSTRSREYESFYNGVSQGKRSSTETSSASYMLGNLMGIHIGAVVDVKITDFLYIQPGIMLNSKGFDMESEEEETSISTGSSPRVEKYKSNQRFNPYYIDVPIMLSLKGTLAENLALRAEAGPYLGFGLFGKGEASSEEYRNGVLDPDNEPKRKIKNVFSPTDEEKERFGFGGLSKFNFGIGFGAGIEYANFYLGLSYNYGLTNAMNKYEYSETDDWGGGDVRTEKGTSEVNAYDRTFSITLGYNF